MNHVYIIAEAGVNHNGDLVIAKKMIDAASESGADAVKFQTFKTSNLVSKYAQKADYQKVNTGPEESQYEMIKKLELNLEAHKELKKYCETKHIEFLSTPFDMESVDLLDSLRLKTFKISSGDITNLPFLRKIGGMNKNIILSSGMSDLVEVKNAVDVLVASGTQKNRIIVLHCNTEYPTPYKDVNLMAMLTIKRELGIEVGYSDHTEGLEIAIAATALGAVVIEKHFTLDRSMNGPDHKASITPTELKFMVSSIRNLEKAIGDGQKKPTMSEIKNIIAARKSIVAIKDIKKGEKLSNDNIGVKRPGNGLSPMLWDNVIGKLAKMDFKEDELIII